MNEAHKRSKLRNRLSRLNRKVKDSPGDKQGSMTARIREIESILGIKK